MKKVPILAMLIVASGLVGAQANIYRCGLEYATTPPPDAMISDGRCKLVVEGKGVVGEQKRPIGQENAKKRDDLLKTTKTLADVRKQYPELAGLNDNQVVDALHQAFYSDLSREKVAAALGVKPVEPVLASREAISDAGRGDTNAKTLAVTPQLVIPSEPEPSSDTAAPRSPNEGDLGGSKLFFGLLAFDMIGYFLIVGIAYGLAFRIGSTGVAYWRVPIGFLTALLVAWLGGGLIAAYIASLFSTATAKNSLLPLLGRGFWWAAFGAGYGVYRARAKLKLANIAPTVAVGSAVPATVSPAHAPPVNSTPPQDCACPTASRKTGETEDDLYEMVGQELDTGSTHNATWLKAFAEADGDEKVAKARYIKYRIDQLKRAQSV